MLDRTSPTAPRGATARWAIRRERASASSNATTEAAISPMAPRHTRLSMEERGMDARPIMPSVKRLAT